MIDITTFFSPSFIGASSSRMFTHRFLSHPPSLLIPQCAYRIIRSIPFRSHLPQPTPTRPSSFLTRSRLLPPSLTRRRLPKTKTVHKTKPLPISPSPLRRRKHRVLWYALAFLASGTITYTILQPDNILNYVFHGIVRCSRVTIVLVRCVYDYRMAMRRRFGDEEEATRDMSECHLRCAKRALKVFEKNGGIYIKLGQHLAALSYLIPIVLFPKTPPVPLYVDVLIGCRNGYRQCQCYKMLVHQLPWKH